MAGAKLIFMGVVHIFIYTQARAQMYAQSKTIADMGKMDDQLVELLRENGIKFATDGTVKNMKSYQRLLAS